jgi:Dockerin type I domain
MNPSQRLWKKIFFIPIICLLLMSILIGGPASDRNYECGDANGDIAVNVSDATWITSYLFRGGIAPIGNADVDECGSVNVADVIYIYEYVFLDGPAPCEGDVTCILPTGNNAISLECPSEVNGALGGSIAIPIYMTTDQAISGFSFGLSHSTTDIHISGIDFSESFLTHQQQYHLSVADHSGGYPYDGTYFITWYVLGTAEFPPLQPQNNGQLCKLWIEVPEGTPAQIIDFDTCSLLDGSHPWEFIFAPPGGGSIIPAYSDCGLAELIITYPEYVCGDTNADGTVNVSDAVWIINYVFVGGDPPYILEIGDVNCDAAVNVSDAVWIINYVFMNGNDPCDTNGDEVPDC